MRRRRRLQGAGPWTRAPPADAEVLAAADVVPGGGHTPETLGHTTMVCIEHCTKRRDCHRVCDYVTVRATSAF